MLGSPKYNEKTEEHVRIKKAICPKDGSIFNFMIRPPNDESEIIDNSHLLAVPEMESVKYLKDDTELRKNVKRVLEVIIGLLKDRAVGSEEPATKKRRVEEIIK